MKSFTKKHVRRSCFRHHEKNWFFLLFFGFFFPKYKFDTQRKKIDTHTWWWANIDKIVIVRYSLQSGHVSLRYQAPVAVEYGSTAEDTMNTEEDDKKILFFIDFFFKTNYCYGNAL